MPTQFERYNFGIISPETKEWIKKLESGDILFLNSLAPFIRITPIEIYGNYIKNISTSKPINFNISQINSQNFKGDFALKQLTTELYSEAASLFKINIDIDIFDYSILESSEISSLFRLGTNAKIEFGWGNQEAIWDFKLDSKLDQLNLHHGKGHELYGIVSMINIDINENNIISVSVQFTSASTQITNDFKLDSVFHLNSQKFKNDYFVVSQKAPRATDDSLGRGKRKSSPAISLYNLFTQIENSIKERAKIYGLDSLTVPEYDLSFKLLNTDQTLNPSLSPCIGINQNVSNPSVGDIMITIDTILELKENSNTVKSFINNICEAINENSLQTLELQAISRPPSGHIISIVNNTSTVDISTSNTNIASNENIKKYLNLSFFTGNTIVKNISFTSDLSDGGKNIQNAIELQAIQGATPIELIEFLKTWYRDKTTDYKKTANQLLAEPYEVLDEIMELYPNIGEKQSIYRQFQNIIKNMKIKNNSLKYLPYKLNCTTLGISDIWLGTRLWFNEIVPVPLLKETLWRLTSVKHSISNGEWITEFDGVCEYNRLIDKEKNN